MLNRVNVQIHVQEIHYKYVEAPQPYLYGNLIRAGGIEKVYWAWFDSWILCETP